MLRDAGSGCAGGFGGFTGLCCRVLVLAGFDWSAPVSGRLVRCRIWTTRLDSKMRSLDIPAGTGQWLLLRRSGKTPLARGNGTWTCDLRREMTWEPPALAGEPLPGIAGKSQRWPGYRRRRWPRSAAGRTTTTGQPRIALPPIAGCRLGRTSGPPPPRRRRSRSAGRRARETPGIRWVHTRPVATDSSGKKRKAPGMASNQISNGLINGSPSASWTLGMSGNGRVGAAVFGAQFLDASSSDCSPIRPSVRRRPIVP